jgi:hypothetical protein
MVTRDISERFTAAEALDFFETICFAKYENRLADPVVFYSRKSELWNDLQLSSAEEPTSYWQAQSLQLLAKLSSWIHDHFDEPIGLIEAHDVWKDLPASFIEEWSCYQTPPLPLVNTVLRFLCRYRFICSRIRYVRTLFRWVRKLMS